MGFNVSTERNTVWAQNWWYEFCSGGHWNCSGEKQIYNRLNNVIL